jgi:aryl-alcohol dehydrogenase-like predicted oxidoreductase
MLTRLIPKTREPLPVIGLGSYRTFDIRDTTGPREIIDAFAQAGGTLVDSSPMYGRSENVIGDCASALGLSGKLFLATKVWTSGGEAGVRQMEDSMRKLRSGKVDLMQVHNLLDVDAHLETLSAWKREGRVRYVGITHYTASAYSAVENLIRARELDFVQINYSIVEREAEPLLSLAADRGVAVIVNRPFAGGALLKRLSKRALPTWASELECDSWAQLALKFVLGHPAVTCVIPATSNLDHLRDYLRAGQGVLPDAAMRERIVTAAK